MEDRCEIIMVDVSKYINKKQQGESNNKNVLVPKQMEERGQDEEKGKILKIVSMQQTEGNSDCELRNVSPPLINIHVSHVDSI